jgi:hypothetical protein
MHEVNQNVFGNLMRKMKQAEINAKPKWYQFIATLRTYEEQHIHVQYEGGNIEIPRHKCQYWHREWYQTMQIEWNQNVHRFTIRLWMYIT